MQAIKTERFQETSALFLEGKKPLPVWLSSGTGNNLCVQSLCLVLGAPSAITIKSNDYSPQKLKSSD